MTKKTKIVATIGLASESEEILAQLIENGLNVARLNFSHGSHEWHGAVIDRIRKISKEKNISVGILADLQGPRIRTAVDGEIDAKKGDVILVSDIAQQNDAPLKLDVPNIVDDISQTNEILIEDGLIKLVVTKKEGAILTTEVVDGGVIKNRKGVNVPDAPLKISAITDKDQSDLEFVLSKEVDFVALSFVSNGADIEDLRDRMKKYLGRENNLPQIIAKIERKEAIKNLDDIISHTDAVMVARGDLGIEIEGTKVAILQKQIIKKSRSYMKPVIVATQMLNSMIENPRPTRAEVSDVTNAVVDHADAVMLSGESASGKYPIESVATMRDIIVNTEASPYDDIHGLVPSPVNESHDELIRSAYKLGRNIRAKAVVMGSASGHTARLFSHFRPTQPLLVVTDNEKTYYQLALVWGVTPWLYEKGGVFREDIDWLIDQTKQVEILKKGDKVITVMGQTPNEESMRLIGVKEIE